MADKERLDVLLVQRNLAPGRDQAKAYIMAGSVYVDGMKEDKAGTKIPVTAQIEVRAASMKYVSRGGYKLEKAMEVFPITLEGKICLDIGASTGGFTDCMLQNGAVKVFAVDVGHGQLAWKLRNDDRVVCMEKMNIRYITPEDIGGCKLDFASADVSFISLDKVLPAVKPLLKPEACMVCLIKPQFEAGRDEVGKKGVVRDKKVHASVISDIAGLSEDLGFSIIGLTFSPVKGPEGNIEYLIHLSNDQVDERRLSIDPAMISRLVDEAHDELDK